MAKNKIIVLLGNTNPIVSKVLKYNFKNADIREIPDSYTPYDREKIAKEINNNYNQVIFYGDSYQLISLLPIISKKINKKWILNRGVAMLSDSNNLNNLMLLFEYYDRGLIQYMGTTRYDLYISFPTKMNFVTFDYHVDDNDQNELEQSVGILNDNYSFYTNFYNELSGIALSKINKAYVLNTNDVTKKFEEDFDIEIIKETSFEKLISKNIINLDCKFCDISPIPFIISMDKGAPCILGNTNLLDEEKRLKEYLVLKSDDDVNEISEKINQSINKKDEIIGLYKEWKIKYSKKSKKSIDDFLKLGDK